MSRSESLDKIEEYLKGMSICEEELSSMLTELHKLKNQKEYGLVWEEGEDAYAEGSYLKELVSNRIVNGRDSPNHWLVEGENYLALRNLLRTHESSVDVIYIDPPYNTGNKNFVYKDTFSDENNMWGHSSWLSFMDKRLRLAYRLMSDEGVMFLSIDDREYAPLKLLCDEIFGEDKRLATFVWDTKTGAKGIPPKKMFVKTHEYVLAYSKGSTFKFKGLYRSPEGFSNSDNDPRGVWKRQYLQRFGQGFSEKTVIDTKTGVSYTFETPYTEENMRKMVEENRIIFPKDTSRYPARKEFYSEYDNPYKPITSNLGLHSQKNASQEIKDFFGEKVFDYPKPLSLIKLLINQHPNKDALVLDFFAGSGTTGQAVMELNSEDKGKRTFILVTNNEVKEEEEVRFLVDSGLIPDCMSRKGTREYKDWVKKVNEFRYTEEYRKEVDSEAYKKLGVARAVTEKRIRKTICGYFTPKGKRVKGLSDNNLYYYEVILA